MGSEKQTNPSQVKQKPHTPTIPTQTAQAVPIHRHGSFSPQQILQLQRTIGNKATAQMVTARTTPRIQRETGLAKGKPTGKFASAIEELHLHWEQLGSPAARKNFIQTQLNLMLDKFNIHNIRIEFSTGAFAFIGEQAEGDAAFRALTWSIEIGQDAFDNKPLRLGGDGPKVVPPTFREVLSLGEKLYHEARHAEQYFRVARYLAGQNRSKQQIGTELSMMDGAITAAMNRPLTKKGEERNEAIAWHTSITTSSQVGIQVGDTKETMLNARNLYFQWVTYSKTNKDQNTLNNLNQAAEYYKDSFTQFDQIYTQYQNIVVEQDAWATGGQIAKYFKFAPETPQDSDEALVILRREITQINNTYPLQAL
jgi:hypothetical protein